LTVSTAILPDVHLIQIISLIIGAHRRSYCSLSLCDKNLFHSLHCDIWQWNCAIEI